MYEFRNTNYLKISFSDEIALARLDKCLIDNMMPLQKYYKCYPLFEQGPCNDGEWFVLSSTVNDTLLPNAHCEKALNCDVFTLKSDYEGKHIFCCANFFLVLFMKNFINLTKSKLSIKLLKKL